MSRTKSDKRHFTRAAEFHAISHKYWGHNNKTHCVIYQTLFGKWRRAVL